MAHVLRLAPGDAVVLFDGQGNAYDAAISKCVRGEVSVQVRGRREEDRESPLQVTLAQAVSSGERMDYTIQKAVELGITAIQPLMAERCVVRLSGERAAKRVTHWQAVVAAACEQCGRHSLAVGAGRTCSAAGSAASFGDGYDAGRAGRRVHRDRSRGCRALRLPSTAAGAACSAY